MSLGRLHLDQVLWLNIWQHFLEKLVEFIYILNWFIAFLLGRLFQKLNVSLLFLNSKPVLMCVWDDCPVRILCSSFNRSCWFEVKLKDLEVVLFLHCSIHFFQCTSTTVSRTAPEHDATVGTVYLGLKTSPLLFQTYLLSWPNSAVFVLSDQKTFLQN